LGYGWVPDGQKQDVRRFKSVQEWKDHGGAKFDMVIKIMLHLMKHRRIAPPIFTDNGEVTWPDPPADVQEGDNERRKMLLYSEFPMMGPSLVTVSLPLFSRNVH
jgi:hypothetical protein